MHKTLPTVMSIAFVLVTSLACALSGTPTQEPDPVGTIVAQTMAASTPRAQATNTAPALPTIILPSATLPGSGAVPTLPPALPTLAVPGAIRMNFFTGATYGDVSDTIAAGGSKTYVLQAFQGQPMMVNVDSPNQDVILSIKTQGGTSMLNASSGQTSWQGSLPQTEDYYLTLHGGASSALFSMSITIPSRLKFQPGEDTIKLNGKTVAGYTVSYVLFAIKDQKMKVEVSPVDGDVALTIYGYNDGQPYVRAASERQSFTFTLPSTQDYIIEVVPRAASVVNYQLTIKVQ